jgi:hypothetical protein
MDELVALTHLSPRTVRHYTALKLIPPVKFAGSATRYPRSTLGKLVAICSWRGQKMGTPQLVRSMRELAGDEEECECWAEDVDPLQPPAPPAPPLAPAPVASVAPAFAPPAESTDIAPSELELGEKWIQVPLIPGLMLTMRDGASEMTVRVAREIQKRYRAG